MPGGSHRGSVRPIVVQCILEGITEQDVVAGDRPFRPAPLRIVVLGAPPSTHPGEVGSHILWTDVLYRWVTQLVHEEGAEPGKGMLIDALGSLAQECSRLL